MNKFPTKKLKDLNDEQKLDFIGKWFKANFIYDDDNRRPIIIMTHDNKRVVFADNRDNHAYTKMNNVTGNREIDYVKLRYIHLIKETLRLQNNPYIKDGYDQIHRQNRRFYYDSQKNYCLVLKRLRGGDFHYISSYFVQSFRERLKRLSFVMSP